MLVWPATHRHNRTSRGKVCSPLSLQTAMALAAEGASGRTRSEILNHRINQWSKQQTEGSIRELLDPKDVTPATAAFLINALYFLGEWEGTAQRPMFLSDNTRTQDFYRADGSTCAVEMMSNKREHRYAELDGFRVLELPYAGAD